MTIVFLVLVVVLFSMTIHEVMHGAMAYYLGDDTAKMQGRLTLNPIKHVDPFLTIVLPLLLLISGGPVFGGAKPVQFNPARLRYDEWGVALVAVAGPITNLVLAFIGFGIASILGINIFNQSNSINIFFSLFVQINLGFFVFNMLPIPPLDGSRVLHALAPDFVRGWLEAIERMGIILIFAIIYFANSLIITYMSRMIDFFLELFKLIFH